MYKYSFTLKLFFCFLVGTWILYGFMGSLVCVLNHVQLFCDPMDCSPPGSSVHGTLPARIQEWVAISSSRGSSWCRDRTCVSCISCIGRWILYHWARWKAHGITTLLIKLSKERGVGTVSPHFSVPFQITELYAISPMQHLNLSNTIIFNILMISLSISKYFHKIH